jgi:hypothetical protein
VSTDDDISFGTEVGGAFKMGRAFGRKWSVEVSGLHVDGHDDDIAVGGVFGGIPGANGNPLANRISLPFNPGANTFLEATSLADSARLSYGSDLYDLQLNGRHAFTDWFALIFGVRYTRLTEQVHLNAKDFDVSLSYDINTVNDMVGPQLGVALGTPRLWDRLSFGFTGKIAPMVNFAKQDQTLAEGPPGGILGGGAIGATTPNGFTRENDDDTADFAYVGELGADVTIHVNDWVQFSFGYMTMFLGGVATAPGQFDFSTATAEGVEDIDTGGDVFYRGGTGMARITFKLP